MKFYVLFLAFICSVLCAWGQAPADAYTFTTFAGATGYGTEDGPGTAARLDAPWGVAVDAAGILYVADTANHTVRKITVDGVVSTLAGTAGQLGNIDGTGLAARFNRPCGIAVDAAGNVYVSDTGNHTIRKITPAGVVTTFAGQARVNGSGDGPGSAASFSSPCGIAVDTSGNLYLADQGAHTIRKITPVGVVTTLAGTAYSSGNADGSGSAARFNWPAGVAVDAGGTVYVADTFNFTIRKISSAGVVTTVSGSGGGTDTAVQFGYPHGLGLDGAGSLYVVNYGDDTIRKLTPAAEVSIVAGQFNKPRGLAVTADGVVYVADTLNNAIRQITTAGAVSTIAGQLVSFGALDGLGAASRFSAPRGVAIDEAGVLYVVDSTNGTIRKVTSSGVVSTFAGVAGEYGAADGQASVATFRYPTALAINGSGNLFVADTYNQIIRKITAAGEVSTLAGLALTTGSADGIGSVARFNSPQGIAADQAGNVYVADTYNHTIRKITPAGVVSTLAGSAGISGQADGAGSVARFYYPYGLTVSADGTLYVADTRNHAIRKVTSTGVVSTLTVTAAGGGGALYYPLSIALDTAGDIYVNQLFGRILRVGGDGSAVAIGAIDNGGDSFGFVNRSRSITSRGITVDSAGNLYAVGYLGNAIRKGVPTPPPTNDNFANAQVISGASGALSATNVAATGESSEPIHWNASGTASSVWYSWTAPNTGRVAFDTSGSYIATAIAGYTGGSVAALAKLAEGGQSTAYISSKILFTVTAGQTYRLAVGSSATGPESRGIFNLSWAYVVTPAPSVTIPPSPLTVTAGQLARFSVTATGEAPFTYQWLKNGEPLGGKTDRTLVLAATEAGDAGVYSVIVSNPGGSTPSQSALLAVAPYLPVLLTNHVPVNGLAENIQSAQRFFHIEVPSGQLQLVIQISGGTGDADLYVRRDGVPSYELYDFRPYLDGNNETITIDNPAEGDWKIMLDAYDPYAGVVIEAGYTSVPAAPTIVTQPTSFATSAGDYRWLYVVATGVPSLSFQWYKDGQLIEGETGSFLRFYPIMPADAGSYTVSATNTLGTQISDPANVVVGQVYSNWTYDQFTSIGLDDLAISGPEADPDRDGLPNLLEYALNLNPKSAEPSAAPVLGTGGGALTLTYTRRKDVVDLVYTVEVSGDLQTWSSGASHTQELSVTAMDAQRDQVVVADRTPIAGSGKRFIRLRVTVSP